jgi:hypothetical protein
MISCALIRKLSGLNRVRIVNSEEKVKYSLSDFSSSLTELRCHFLPPCCGTKNLKKVLASGNFPLKACQIRK